MDIGLNQLATLKLYKLKSWSDNYTRLKYKY